MSNGSGTYLVIGTIGGEGFTPINPLLVTITEGHFKNLSFEDHLSMHSLLRDPQKLVYLTNFIGISAQG
ncbi:Uncharacterised protein [Vibrio cholerae]|nr:Uncharacterised protein [Vibrio cholerae]